MCDGNSIGSEGDLPEERSVTRNNNKMKAAAKITEELGQPNEKSDAKQDGILHTKARFWESLKEKWKNKVMNGQYIRNIDCLLVKKTRSSGYRRET